MARVQSLWSIARNSLPVLVVVLFGTGCSSVSPMALSRKASGLDVSKKTIVIFTVKTANVFKPDHQVNLQRVAVLPPNCPGPLVFRTEKPYSQSKDSCEYMVSVAVAPGAHTLKALMGTSLGISIWLGIASFDCPVDASFVALPNTVTYIGHLELKNLERKQGEPRSGPALPVFPQSMAGFFNGTFDVSVSDAGAADIPLFVRTYPCLRETMIGSVIMALPAK